MAADSAQVSIVVRGVENVEVKMGVYTEKFNKAVEYVLKNEGGHYFDKLDKGGETNFGICKRNYPNLDVWHLTREQAIKIYYCDYWLKGRFEQIPNEELGAKMFDLSVNMGIYAETLVLQRALRAAGIAVDEDGIFGEQTLAAVTFADQKVLMGTVKSEAAGYYRSIVSKDPSQKKFLKGWLNRAYRNVALN